MNISYSLLLPRTKRRIISLQNELIAHSQSEIIRKNAIIERKQGQIDQFNKKIDQLQSKEGGEEMGPLELQITNLHRQIKDVEQQKQQLEQYWLKEQAHLVWHFVDHF